ncbi:HbrB-like-domain-containing protein [Truncatella angustata]|uniref:HbrB-like-domain-containing protein n=1 Tax=Truncatella angustata TaxID=152316 RepID=A0A9P8UAS5_9PEZI|nr:HbrB-like-domain-containing protein [Truncatella angustata]KAH6640011.1 HbrB-like-domain-containing protein [Truncatella angustata]
MQPSRTQRAPGSFSPLPGSVSLSSSAAVAAAAASSSSSSNNARLDDAGPPPPLRPAPQPYQTTSSSQFSSSSSRPLIRRIESSSSEGDNATTSQISLPKIRSPQSPVSTGGGGGITSPTSAYASFTQLSNNSSSSLHNFSRPGMRSNQSTYESSASSARTASPLPPRGGLGLHARKHSQSQGLFDTSLGSKSMAERRGSGSIRSPSGVLPASHIAAQAAVQQHQQHSRHRSQTVPFPGSEAQDLRRPAARPVQGGGSEAGGSSRGPLSPPVLSLTEASVPRDGGALLGPTRSNEQAYQNALLGGYSSAATAAANMVFPRASPQSSPSIPTPDQAHQSSSFLPPLSIPEKPAKAEKSKVKLFSRPKKIDIKGESKEKPLPSPGKIGSALASLQRGNFSTASLVESQSMYSLANSSSATIRPIETPLEGPAAKEKEKKHHFLSRQKHKISGKEDYHLPLSSAASNSRPVDPNAPSSLYNFNLPPSSPGPTSTSFSKSVSGLDLRHGGRALRDKRKEEKLVMAHDNESVFTLNPPTSNSEWPGPSSLGSSLTQTQSNHTLAMYDPVDGSKYGLHNMTLDDAWPYLKAKLLVVFEGEDLRLPIEDFNRVVTLHIQWCIKRNAPNIILEDLRELLSTGFASLDHTLRKSGTEDTNRLIPALVDVWMATFTSILPYMQAVFLPLDLEFSGTGPLLTAEQARDFWGGVAGSHGTPAKELGSVLDIRRLVIIAFRDALILPRYDKLKTIFSRLSLEHLPSSLASLALASPPPISEGVMSSSPRDAASVLDMQMRPGTAMSLDPSIASYNSSSSTLLNDGAGSGSGGNGSNPSRSRAISNVSFGSAGSGTDHLLRPFVSRGRADSDRERNNRDRDRDQEAEMGSKQVTDMVGRMLQCMSVLASVASRDEDTGREDAGSRQVAELGRLLKLNWLGRGRTGRNRRGMVGGRINLKRDKEGETRRQLGMINGVYENKEIAGHLMKSVTEGT